MKTFINYAIENHLEYMFAPQQDRLLSQINTIEVIGGIPIIDVKVTKLFGMGRIWKRLMDFNSISFRLSFSITNYADRCYYYENYSTERFNFFQAGSFDSV